MNRLYIAPLFGVFLFTPLAYGQQQPEILAKPESSQFVGTWSGQWDNKWEVRLQVTKGFLGSMTVSYEWLEDLGEPHRKRDYNGYLQGSTLSAGPLELQVTAASPNILFVRGNFKQKRSTLVLNVEKATSGDRAKYADLARGREILASSGLSR